MRLLPLIAASVAVVLALSACTPEPLGGLVREPGAAGTTALGGAGPHSNRGDSNEDGMAIASLRPGNSAAVAKYLAQRVSWTPCHSSFECGSVRVPIDWDRVGTKSIRIALVMHRASGVAVGDLLVNPGGPGGSGVDFVEAGVRGVVDGRIAQQYNVIGFDPRGVERSAPVKCFDDAGTDAYFYDIDPGTIGSAVWIAAEKKKSRDLAAACAKGTGPVLGHIDSISVAEDMDVIRAALGDSKLNYLGYSYGTYLGTLYAGLFPSRVGQFVLDGVDDPWGDGSESRAAVFTDDFGVTPDEDGTVAQAVGFEDSLTTYLRRCIDNSRSAVGKLACPFSGPIATAKSGVEAQFARVNAHPLAAKDGRKLGGATLATAISDALYDDSDWPQLTRMFIELKQGNPTKAFDFADEYNNRNPDGTYENNSDFQHIAISCVEDGNEVDLAFDRREATELKKVAPMLGIYSAYGDLLCSGWKFTGSAFPNPIHARGTGPILVLGNTGDPATPYQGAVDLADQLDNGHLVTEHGQGHTSYDLGDACINRTVDNYLLAGTVPTKDPNCP